LETDFGADFHPRDEAMRRTKSLQAQIVAENEKVGGLMRFFSSS